MLDSWLSQDVSGVLGIFFSSDAPNPVNFHLFLFKTLVSCLISLDSRF